MMCKWKGGYERGHYVQIIGWMDKGGHYVEVKRVDAKGGIMRCKFKGWMDKGEHYDVQIERGIDKGGHYDVQMKSGI